MENSSILGEMLYVYQHRIDAPHNVGDKLVKHCKEHSECKYYLFAKEQKKDGTQHYQGIVFLSKPLVTTKERMSWSNVKTRKWVYQHRNSVSFTKAKNPASLAKYCNNKEELGIITNLSEEQLAKIGAWQPIEKIKKSRRQKEDDELKHQMEKNISQYGNKDYICYQQVMEDLALIAYDVYERPPPMRSLVITCKQVIPKKVFIQCLYRELRR